ncbi:MAG: hypothetical protein ACF8GE_08985 [Phycisphaerales bacterium JB043]
MDTAAEPDVTTRTSLMALVALGLSVMCPIPALGLVGAILGALSLRRIGLSGGRLSGGGPAKAAVILGLIATSLQVFLLFGAAQSWTYYRRQMQPEMVRAIEAIGSPTLETNPPVWDTIVLERLTPERHDEVRALLEGQRVRVRIGIGEMWRSFATLVRGSSVRPSGAGGPSAAQAVPCTIEIDEEEMFAWFFFDADALSNKQLRVSDVMFVMEDGRVTTLLPDGPANELASEWLGWVVEEPSALR